MRKLILAAAMAAVAAPTVPAFADPPSWAPAHGRRAKEAYYRGDEHRGYDRGDYRGRDRDYYRGQYYAGPVWRGGDGRVYCRRSNGTTGLILGAGAGALLGRAVDTRGERTTGTLLGAAAGALLGRQLDRNVRCR
ncbi:MAG TPA: glycine zipper 2TM domain-containing protein [Sphingomonas sp.]|nr:glycine zipper 2TM domain-containing protein [Sphingomonas sp.]